ncbi:DUF3558 family protein [Nocardia stercoris]|uniref:DUF3558 family protein n=1 Tax=Nocardia stercoris TaxID=2483361 RepID=UPI00131A1F1D|nr:DUF3558 family protein [Nocardia stercoris]
MRSVVTAVVALLAAGLVAGCSGGSAPAPVRAAVDPNLLSGCGPLDDSHIGAALAATVAPQTSPTVCTWRVTFTGGGTADLTYAWLQHDTLLRDSEVAAAQGYRTDKLILKRFGAMYWRDPRDPGSCAVTAADSGTLTWWVQNRDHSATPEPCAAALALLQATLDIDGV